MAVDGLHFVMSRTSLLDGVLMFFVLAAFGCLLVDRDRARARLAAALPVDEDGAVRPDADAAETTRLGLAALALAAGLLLGLAIGTKWNGLYILAAFGVMAVLWDVGVPPGGRRPAPLDRGAQARHRPRLPRDGPGRGGHVPRLLDRLDPVPADGSGGYFRDWAATDGRGGTGPCLPDWLRSLWHYEHEVYKFHVGLSSPHTYQSNPWSWLVLGRPVSYFYESPLPGKDGCPADAGDKCAREVLALGTPLLWWAACFALLYVL